MKRTIESLTPPADKQVMWLDISQEVKQLKAYINGEWVVVNDDTKNNEEIVNKVLEKIDNVLDIMSYGVSWKPNVADPKVTRVGNMSYHKTLPIQNNMRGCIAQMKDGVKIMYFLDPTDWRFKEDHINSMRSGTLTVTKNTYTLKVNGRDFDTLQYKGQWLKVNDILCQILAIDTSTETATIKPNSPIDAGVYNVELGAVLNGYDGEVMVLVPEFWIKSWDTDTRREVRISPSKIDDTWEHQPRILIGAYHDTVLNTVPENMGYLSTLEVNSALSIVNTHDYCRGGNNDSTYDQYITTDSYRSMLGKPRTNIPRAAMRAYCRKSGKEILSYLQYKRVLYWLYIIEYANFNCQDDFVYSDSNHDFKMGGLGYGVTTVPSHRWDLYNRRNPLVPNGYTNEFGNRTNVKNIFFMLPNDDNSEVKDFERVPRWHGIENPFGDIMNNVDGIIIEPESLFINRNIYSEVFATDDPSLYGDSYTQTKTMKKVGIIRCESGYIREWDLGDTAEIVPRMLGGNATQFKCDYHSYGRAHSVAMLCLGSDATGYNNAGLGSFNTSYEPTSSSSNIGYRSSCVVDKKSF